MDSLFEENLRRVNTCRLAGIGKRIAKCISRRLPFYDVLGPLLPFCVKIPYLRLTVMLSKACAQVNAKH